MTDIESTPDMQSLIGRDDVNDLMAILEVSTKDVNEVVEVVHNANLARKVARMKPIGVVKG